MTRWGEADNSVVAGDSCRRSHIMDSCICRGKKFGLVLFHGDYGWILSREVGGTYIYILER